VSPRPASKGAAMSDKTIMVGANGSTDTPAALVFAEGNGA
jgi:hypothetical protein